MDDHSWPENPTSNGSGWSCVGELDKSYLMSWGHAMKLIVVLCGHKSPTTTKSALVSVTTMPAIGLSFPRNCISAWVRLLDKRIISSGSTVRYVNV